MLLHGYNSQKEDMSFWAYLLAQAGYRAILLDLRGHGESTGQNFTYGKYETTDLRQVLDYLTAQQLCDGTVGVLGVGFGANVGLQWAAGDSRVRTVVAIAPYNRPVETFERIARVTQAPIPSESLRLALAQVATRLQLDWTDWSGQAVVRRLRNPILLVGGGRDLVSPAADVESLANAAPPGSKSVFVRDADHQAVCHWFPDLKEPVLAWFQAHFPPSVAEQVDRRPATPHSRSLN
jgi:pimeloyl-ACP methyl ester carboxylesterase